MLAPPTQFRIGKYYLRHLQNHVQLFVAQTVAYVQPNGALEFTQEHSAEILTGIFSSSRSEFYMFGFSELGFLACPSAMEGFLIRFIGMLRVRILISV